jgi:mono/diheme cytochrome c family protein
MLGLLCLAGAAMPAKAQDAINGARLASQWCGNCHAVGARGTDMVPPLQEIAQRPGRDVAYLRTFLTSPHPPMPPFQLSRSDIADLAAYIAGLRQR